MTPGIRIKKRFSTVTYTYVFYYTVSQKTSQFVIFTRESRMLRASLPSSGRTSVCLSVRLSVRHTRELYQNGASWDHEIFTVDCPKVSSLS